MTPPGIQMQIQELVIYGLGILFLFILVVVVSTAVRVWVTKWLKEKPSNNRRSDVPNGSQHWTVEMLVQLKMLNGKTCAVHEEVQALNKNLMNGLTHDIKEIKGVLDHCRETNKKA